MSRLARAQVRIKRTAQSVGLPRQWHLIPLAAAVGVLAGLVAVGFDYLVESSGAFFFGVLGERLGGSGYLMLLLLPAIGGLAVGLIQQFIAKSTPSHGIPEVVEALARNHGIMQGRQAVFKVVTSSLTIGSGGSAGVEGPIIMIGSILGSKVSQLLHIGRENVHTLVGCGAAAGLAAIFNAPIAGVMFVLEVLLRDFSFKTFIPIVVASVFGVATAQAVLGENMSLLNVPPEMRNYAFQFYEILPYAVLGVACGLLGVTFGSLLRHSERMAKQNRIPRFIRPAIGGLMVGVLGMSFIAVQGKAVPTYEPPAFYGNGYQVIEAFLNPGSYTADAGTLTQQQQQIVEQEAQTGELETVIPGESELTPIVQATIPLVLMLVVCKLVATILTLASGGSGGILAPSLFMGAIAGAGVGMLTNATGLMAINPATYALAGMAGTLAAVVHCPLTGFLLAFELTQDYKVIVPMMLVAILATFTAQIFNRDSIYTAWLRKMGIRMGSHADMTLLRRLEVRDVPLLTPVIVHPVDPAQTLIEMAERYSASDFVVCDDDNHYVGMVVGDDLRTTLVQREAVPLMIVEELMRTNLPTVEPEETLDVVLDKFAQHEVSSLAVLDTKGDVRGTISRTRLMRQYQRLLEQ